MRIGNNIQKQVYENTKDIEELQNKVKPEYNCSATLTSSSVSVAIASTNAPVGTDSGWLLTADGLKFKITGGDDTNLLLEFYADLKGPQGEDGAALNIDDSTTSLTKVWSSSKTANVISGLINDSITSNINTWSSDQQTKLLSSGIAWTTTDKDGDDQISLSNIYLGSRTAYESLSIIKVPQLKVSDLIVYVDGDLKAKTLYRVSSISSGVATVAKVCDFGGGKQLYINNVTFTSAVSWYAGETRYLRGTIQIICDTKMENKADFLLWYNSITEPQVVFGVMQGYMSGWITLVRTLEIPAVANQLKLNIASINHTSCTAETITTTTDMSSGTFYITVDSKPL